MNNKIKMIIVTLFSVFLLFGCAGKETEKTETTVAVEAPNDITIIDALGREVKIEGDISSTIAIGPGCLRLYSYVGDISKVVGVEQIEVKNNTGRPYTLAYPELTKLPIIGPGGPNNAPDAEKIVTVAPNVIFSTYNSEKSAADDLQAKTGIPVVVLSYGKTATFDEQMYNSLETIGKVMGTEDRATEVLDYMKECAEDLNTRTANIAEDAKPKVYAGALSMRGSHGIESTQGNYSLFKAINAKNVVDETGHKGSLMVDKEKLIEWNPEILFIDYGGLEEVTKDYAQNPTYYKTLTAFDKGEVYPILPYNFYSTNIDTSMIDCYYMGTIIYPEQFKDIDIAKKAEEVYTKLLKKDVYLQMVEDFGPFEKLEIK